MQCPHCNAPIDDDTVFCGNCGKQIKWMQAAEAATRYNVERGPPRRNLPYVPASYRTKQANTPLPPSRLQPRHGNFGRVALFATLILLLLVGASVGAIVLLKKNTPPVRASANGQVVFTDGQNSTGHTDALKMIIHGLQMSPSGFQYDAWLINEQDEQTVPLGTLLAKDGAFTLNFAGDGHHTNLLDAGNEIEITLA